MATRPRTTTTHLTRSTIRPSSPKPRVLLIRQPVKSVRQSDQPDRMPVQLAIGVISGVGAVLLLWVMGYLGFRLGYAPLVRVPDMMITPGGALAMAASMFTTVPRSIMEAGLTQPAWLMLGFALIAVPAAGLSAARPIRPGRARPATVYVVMAAIGAAAGAVNGGVLIWWTVSAKRLGLLGELPFAPGDAALWVSDLRTVAGLDVLAMLSAATWAVLALRLPVPLWLRSLAATANFFTLVVVIVATSVSSGAVAGVTADRAMGLIDDAPDEWRLLLGSTEHYSASVIVTEQTTLVELRDRPAIATIVGKESVVGFLERKAEEKR